MKRFSTLLLFFPLLCALPASTRASRSVTAQSAPEESATANAIMMAGEIMMTGNTLESFTVIVHGDNTPPKR